MTSCVVVIGCCCKDESVGTQANPPAVTIARSLAVEAVSGLIPGGTISSADASPASSAVVP